MIIYPNTDDPLLPYLGLAVKDYLLESNLALNQVSKEQIEETVKWLSEHKGISIDMDSDSGKFNFVEIRDSDYTILLLKYVK